MQLDFKKELVPVIFDETSVKVLTTHATAKSLGFTPHWHERIELHLVKSGCLELCCNEQKVSVNAGEVSIVSPTVLHSGKPGKDGYDCYVLMFELSDLCSSTISSKEYIKPIINGDIRFNFKTDNPQIVKLASKIVEMHTNQNEYHPLETVGCLYELLGLLCKYCIDKNYISPKKTERFDSVINYINSNFTKNISVAGISRKFGYDESYFCRKFKSVTGIGATKYICTLRLEHARELLQKTDYSVRHISVLCGFADTAYFTNCFKNMYGIPPTAYKKQCINTKTNPM